MGVGAFTGQQAGLLDHHNKVHPVSVTFDCGGDHAFQMHRRFFQRRCGLPESSRERCCVPVVVPLEISSAKGEHDPQKDQHFDP
ncbi:hypothetical protein D3C73_1573980 [compost metagenome]